MFYFLSIYIVFSVFNKLYVLKGENKDISVRKFVASITCQDTTFARTKNR